MTRRILVVQMLAAVAVFASLALFEARPAEAATYIVDTTSDANLTACTGAANDCSLRGAINAANGSAGADTINFNIPGAGVRTIQPASALPSINDPVVIDGSTQAGASCPGTLLIEIDGTNAGPSANGIQIAQGPSTIRGLVINRFTGSPRAAIYLTGNGVPGSGGNTIECDHIGTNAAGTAALPNRYGILINSANNTIGGTSAAQRNVISGNNDAGIRIEDNGFGMITNLATGNVIQGNFIGTDVAGAAAIPNQFPGVWLNGPSGNTVGGTAPGAGNVISGNNSVGVSMSGSNTVQGNYIGTDVTGSVDLGNLFGVTTNGGGMIGGSTTGARNVISGNAYLGIQLSNSASVVQGNYIGTDASGTVAIPNDLGLVLTDADDSLIGGTGTGEGNVISGNFSGISIQQSSAGTLVEGNLIGTASDGISPLGNTLYGVAISEGAVGTTASDNTVGGTAPGAGNTIAYNGQSGVWILSQLEPPAVCCNPVLGNSIHSNGGLGIDLGPTGATANDAGDADSGPNGLQNYPAITSASTAGGSTTVTGTLQSAADTQFRIEFFSSPACDQSGHGEGKTFMGFADVTTDSLGNATFSPAFSPAVAFGEVVTATASDPANNTSEFSICQRSAPPPLESVSSKIGAAGGTFSTGSSDPVEAELTLPAGALAGSTVITVDAFSSASIGAPPGSGNYLPRAYRFEPSGLTFSPPAVVRVNYSTTAGGMSEATLGAWIFSYETGWQVAPVVERNPAFDYIKVQVAHFSILAVGILDTSDFDGDGCTDNDESQTDAGSETSGGRRDAVNYFDYFNPTGDGKNRVDDILAVVYQYYDDAYLDPPANTVSNPNYDPDTDRTDDPGSSEAWDLLAGNGLQRVDDILAAVKQYYHDCA